MTPSPLLPPPDPTPSPGLWLAAILLSTAILLLIYLRQRHNRKHSGPTTSDPRAETLHALTQIQEINSDPSTKAVQISLLLRRFLYKAFNHPALYQTPIQRRQSLASNPSLPQPLTSLIIEIDTQLHNHTTPDNTTIQEWTNRAPKLVKQIPPLPNTPVHSDSPNHDPRLRQL